MQLTPQQREHLHFLLGQEVAILSLIRKHDSDGWQRQSNVIRFIQGLLVEFGAEAEETKEVAA